jgi:positive regulator of sigma E activity
MNRSLLIIAVPALLVLAGYIIVLRQLGLTPGYLRLLVAAAGFLVALWLVRRYQRKKARATGR